MTPTVEWSMMVKRMLVVAFVVLLAVTALSGPAVAADGDVGTSACMMSGDLGDSFGTSGACDGGGGVGGGDLCPKCVGHP